MSSASVGYSRRDGVFVESRVARLRGETTESLPIVGIAEAPYTIGLRATIVEAHLDYRPARLHLGPVQPMASVGVAAARVVDTWESDTPREERSSMIPGVGAAAGLETVFGHHVVLVARGSYRYLNPSGDRPARHVGLRTTAWDVGLQWRP